MKRKGSRKEHVENTYRTNRLPKKQQPKNAAAAEKDGDAKTYSGVVQLKPYKEVDIVKKSA